MKPNLGNVIFKTKKPGWSRSLIGTISLVIFFAGTNIILLVFSLPGTIQSFSSNFLSAMGYLVATIILSLFLLYMFLSFLIVIVNRFISGVILYQKGLSVRKLYPLKYLPKLILYQDIVDFDLGSDEDAKEILSVDIQALTITYDTGKVIKIHQDDVNFSDMQKINEILMEKQEKRKN